MSTTDFSWLKAHQLDFLHPKELDYLKTLTVERRQASYLLGRFCAKQAAATLHPTLLPETIAIEKGVFEFPFISSTHDESFEVSISHSQNLGAAIAYPVAHPMAIDIEKISLKKTRVIETQMELAEIKKVEDYFAQREIALTALWTIKEALSKALKCGMMVNFKLLEIATIEDNNGTYVSHFKYFGQYKAITFQHDTWMCSIVLPRKSEVTNFNELLMTKLAI